MTGATVRRTPCSTCPYRRNVASGIWHPDEYAKLPAYDGETFEQPVEAFGCHHADGQLCAGWVAAGDRADQLLALRVGVASGIIDPSVFDYTTTVPLFDSGAEAAAHGLRDIRRPSERAISAQTKVVRERLAREGIVTDGPKS